jgi:hypothetical protein
MYQLKHYMLCSSTLLCAVITCNLHSKPHSTPFFLLLLEIELRTLCMLGCSTFGGGREVSCCAAQSAFELTILLSVGITGVRHHA